MKCPCCNSGQIRQRKRDRRMRCQLCGNAFYPSEIRVEKTKTLSGSGVIAGKILVGRGMKWGAGW